MTKKGNLKEKLGVKFEKAVEYQAQKAIEDQVRKEVEYQVQKEVESTKDRGQRNSQIPQ
jgi:hypothetical protein